MSERPEIGDAELDAAMQRGRRVAETTPRAASARYDQRTARVVVELTNGCTFLFPPSIAQDLQGATPDQLAEIEVSPAGFGLHWPQIDVDFTVAGLVSGVFGTASFMDAQRRGGQSRSPAKTAAARENGKKGGRPRKSA